MNYDCIDLPMDEVLQKFIDRDSSIQEFYQHLEFNQNSIDAVTARQPHAHTSALADIIEAEMAPFGLTEAQRENIDKLRNNHRVIIGGQQAGLLLSPQYILHKVYTILILQNEVKEKYDYDAVPVFWIAGEDHDFDEVNHTYVYDSHYKKVKKVAYKPNLNVPMSIGFYEYDKKAMRDTFTSIVRAVGDSKVKKPLIEDIFEMIEKYTYWTELFHAIVHAMFKDTGLLIVNSHSPQIRKLEIPMFEKLIDNSEAIDNAFREGQKKFNTDLNTTPTIETETDMHLFINSTTERELTSSIQHSKEELKKQLHDTPEIFSNNVVTRPIMQEMLFNTLMFVGGGAEVKYWGEINEVFKVLEIPMPIIIKRMEFMYATKSLMQELKAYDLSINPNLPNHVEDKKEAIINQEVDSDVIKSINDIRNNIPELYAPLHACIDDASKRLSKKNESLQLQQLDYMERRYRLEQKRKVRSQLNKLDALVDYLYPTQVLQERKYHSLIFTTKPWEIPPLSYTTSLVLIETV